MCSNTANKILQRHVLFAFLMAHRIDDASKSQYNLKFDGPKTTKLTKNINKASHSLSTNVTQMTHILNLFVSTLEKVQVTVEKERLMVERILRWLKSLLKAIAKFFATLSHSGAFYNPLRPRARNVRIALDAVDDIQFCEKLVDKWIESDKVRTSESLFSASCPIQRQ